MTERTPWWMAFLPKKKSGGSKDTSTTHTTPHFDPFAPRSEKQKDSGDQALSQQEAGIHSNDTNEESRLETYFNEQTCRRNMRISRSGRFKVKGKIRQTLPTQEKETDNVASGKEDMRGSRGGVDDQRLPHKMMHEEKERDSKK
ncbi:proline-rich protein 15-like [Epinephelus fuscoguttatus]|uniref:proline-rich protein 15-like n=1 Tax=Epinephelus fuscoguttatus TaxID=293821 RepID=UPI0020D199CD|nr:proline-rich protein 15-like [Epinephelus fuscoguttatus]